MRDAGSDGSNAPHEAPSIDICVCSYRRPEIDETLRAVAAQAGIGLRGLRIVVADNTAEAVMQGAIRQLAEGSPVPIEDVHAPANNISIARNACLDAARAEWIAFLDDDEIPAVHWLAALFREAISGGWDAVLGPVDAVYAPDVPDWMAKGKFHSTRPAVAGGVIRTGYTGNALIRRGLVDAWKLRFRIDLGLSGGEDNDFFYRFTDAGGRIGFAPRATISEKVETARANFRWLVRRSFRAGQSHGSRLGPRSRTRNILIALCKAAYCIAAAALNMPFAVRRNRSILRAALHCGVVARLCGLRELEVYRKASPLMPVRTSRG